MKRTIWKLFSCLMLVYNINACKSKGTPETTKVSKGGKPAAPPPIKVEGYIIKTSTLNESIDVSGTLLPYEETEIHPEVAGKVVMLSIKEGAYVGRGSLLAKLFDGDLQAQLRKLNIQLQIAQKTQDRQTQLLTIGGISQQDFDLSLLNVSTIRADMQVLQANISKTIIRAPFNGKIGFKNISIGAYITPATVITTIRQIDKLKLEFSIPEKYSAKVTNGDFINFSIEGVPKKYAAKIIATESEISADNRSLKVRAVVEAVDKFATAGAFAKVTFNMGDNNMAMMVPSQAIIPGARDKKVIVNRMGTATFQTIKTGERDSANVQILSGVAVGDTIITTGILQLKPAGKIVVTSIKK